MDQKLSGQRSFQLQTLFPVLKFSGCDEQVWSQFWNTFSAPAEKFHQPLEPSSRMARFTESEASLDSIQQLQQQLQQQIYLREAIQRIRRVLCVKDVYSVAVQTLMDFFQADWICIFENGPYCWQSVAASLYPADVNSTHVIHEYLGLESVAPKLARPFPIALDEQSLQRGPVDKQGTTQFSGTWLLGPIHLPHANRGQPIRPWGLVAIGRKDKASLWTTEQLEQAKILVDEIAIALHHSLLYEQIKQDNRDLQTLALKDSLTGLANRRQFDRYFDAEWQRLAREHQPLTLILCDIDYFKRYNDSYGHPSGDICLAQVGDVLTKCIRRPADLVARYGGEEFAVILPNTDTGGGHSVAEAIREGLAKAAIPHCTSSVSDAVTLTMGIATVVPDHHLIAQDLLQAADLALYHAKQQGRDRIYVHAHYFVNTNAHSEHVDLGTHTHDRRLASD
ncbi:MAG: diguanylate cyclase [Cyanobacteria bacterium P01_H01_bin.21]